MKVAVLGAGMVGSAIALDLASGFQVAAIDVNESNLALLNKRNPAIKTQQADLSNYELYPVLLNEFDIVITAVPGFMGYKTLGTVINCGKDVVDISFFPEDVLKLDELAKKKGVTVITDCGVAPGMSNLIVGRYNEEMTIDAIEIYVGGLPKVRKKTVSIQSAILSRCCYRRIYKTSPVDGERTHRCKTCFKRSRMDTFR